MNFCLKNRFFFTSSPDRDKFVFAFERERNVEWQSNNLMRTTKSKQVDSSTYLVYTIIKY